MAKITIGQKSREGLGMKNIMAYIIIFFLICSIGNYSIDYTLGRKIENQSPYRLALVSIGANLVESRLDCWAKSTTFHSLSNLVQIVAKLTDDLDIPFDEEKMDQRANRDENILKYEIQKGNDIYRITVKSNRKFNETYYALSFSSPDEKHSFQKQALKLREMPGMNWKIYFLKTGCIDGNIAYDSQKAIIDVILRQLAAEKRETFADGRVTSVTAHSDLIKKLNPCIVTENGKYNTQVAIRVNEKERKTYILIGNPLILDNY